MLISNVKKSVYDYLICGLILVLPYSLKLPNLFLITAILFFIFDFKDYKNLKFDRLKSPSFIILGTLLLYFIIKGLVTNTISENKYGLLLPVILIPFLFIKVRDYKKIFLTILITGFLLITTAIVGLVSHYLAYDQLLPFEGESVNEILNMERPYLGFFIVFCLIISLELADLMKKYKHVFFIYASYATFALFLMSARISSITIIALVAMYLIFYLRASVKYKIIVSLISISILSVILVSNKSLQERLFILKNFDESFAKFNLYEPRVIIWPCAYEIASNEDFNSIFGIDSEKEIDNLLTQCYDHKILNKHRANFFVASQLNTHNQFLGYYLASGMIGLVLLILFFVIEFYQNRKIFMKIALLTSVLFFFLVENVLYRQLGVYLFILIVSTVNLYFRTPKKEEEDLADV